MQKYIYDGKSAVLWSTDFLTYFVRHALTCHNKRYANAWRYIEAVELATTNLLAVLPCISGNTA